MEMTLYVVETPDGKTLEFGENVEAAFLWIKFNPGTAFAVTLREVDREPLAQHSSAKRRKA